MKTCYILLGSNIGDASSNIQRAVKLLCKHLIGVTEISSLYRTAAWGKTDQEDFVNQVISIETDEDAFQILKIIHKIEYSMGRERKEKWGPRIIDIDILLFDQEIIKEQALQIPHKELENRSFALTPLAEIAGEIIHPVLNKSIHQLLEECTDQLKVLRI